MNDTMPARRAAPIAAVVLTVAAALMATWAAVGSEDRAAAPVTSVVAPVGATTAAPVVTPTPPTSAGTTAATAPPETSATPTVAPTTISPLGTTVVGPVPSPDEVVLAMRGQDTIEVWTPGGRLGSAAPCGSEPGCFLLASSWADGTVVSGVAVRAAVSTRTALVRSPLDGGAPLVLAELDPWAWVSAVAVVGADVWWLEQPTDGTAGGRVRRMPLDAGLAGATDVAAGVDVFAPRPDGGAVALRRSGPIGPDGSVLSVLDLPSGQERSVALGSEMPWSSAITWLGHDRLLVQGADAAVVVDAGAELVALRTLPFIVACVDTESRVIGVVRTTSSLADEPPMRHTLAEVDLVTGRTVAWAGDDLPDGAIACRGDGALLSVSFTPDGVGTELAALRGSGRRTVLGRGYVSLSSGRGAGGFSSMNCGPADGGESGPL